MNRLEDILKPILLKNVLLELFCSLQKTVYFCSAVQSVDAGRLLSSNFVCIKNRAKHINSMCWQTVERLVSRTGCTGMYNYHCAATSENVQLPYNKQ